MSSHSERETKLQYDRLFSGRLVQERREKELCLNCGKPAREGKTQCQACADYHAQRLAEKRKGKLEEQPTYDAIQHSKWRQQIREFIQQQKLGRSCEVCGISDFRVLDFHHSDQDEKKGGIAQAEKKGWGKQRILDEIAKCQVLCSNCHRILHWEERNKQ